MLPVVPSHRADDINGAMISLRSALWWVECQATSIVSDILSNWPFRRRSLPFAPKDKNISKETWPNACVRNHVIPTRLSFPFFSSQPMESTIG